MAPIDALPVWKKIEPRNCPVFSVAQGIYQSGSAKVSGASCDAAKAYFRTGPALSQNFLSKSPPEPPSDLAGTNSKRSFFCDHSVRCSSETRLASFADSCSERGEQACGNPLSASSFF